MDRIPNAKRAHALKRKYHENIVWYKSGNEVKICGLEA
jgi:hypothetical protein